MNLFLFILFLIIGIAGLVFKVDAGVFVGLSLMPWELIKMELEKKFIITAIVLTSLIGSIFFISRGQWQLFAFLILVELYNVWGFYREDNFDEKKLDK